MLQEDWEKVWPGLNQKPRHDSASLYPHSTTHGTEGLSCRQANIPENKKRVGALWTNDKNEIEVTSFETIQVRIHILKTKQSRNLNDPHPTPHNMCPDPLITQGMWSESVHLEY